jgi:acyl dehydratase
MPTLFYEDCIEGDVREYGPRTITRDEIIAYAREYDAQPMHLDEEAAKKTMLGGLAASGWHTCCFMFRMTYDFVVKDSASMGSPGVEEVKWLKPVRPDTALTLRMTVLDKRVSKSRPEMGLVRLRVELLDEQRVPVISQLTTFLIGLRAPAKEPA